MRNKTRVKQIVAVLLPIIFLLGIVLTLPKGNSLKADDSEQLFATVKLAGKTETLTDVSVKEDTIEVELTGKKTELIELPDNSAYEVFQVDEEGETVSLSEKPETDLAEMLEKNTVDSTVHQEETEEKTVSSTEATSTSEESENSLKPEVFHVTNEDGQGKTYLQVVEDEPLTVVIQRKTDKEVPIVLEAAQKEEDKQQLFTFEELPVESETKESETETVRAEVETKQSTVDTDALETSKETEKETSSESETNSKTKSNEPTNEVSEKENQEVDSEKNESDKADDSNEYENIQFVETKTTEKTLDELNSEDYDEKDSLRTPKFLPETKEQQKETRAGTGTISIRDAKIVKKTGTDSFDAGNDSPGYDSSANNHLVRSFDQIIYLVSFSVQNDNTETKYSDIKYRVISKLPDAFRNVNGTFVNVGAIANGQSYDLPSGEQYSEGIMESVISDTGQIFVPVTLNVFGAKHGTSITPEFELEIVEATNKETGEVEVIEKAFNDTQLPNLKVQATTVSAKPSVSVELVQGEIKKNTVFGSTNLYMGAYDVGVITKLKPIATRAVDDYRGSTFPSGEITYKIEQSATYQIGTAGGTLTSGVHYDPFYVEAYAPAVTNRSVGDWKKTIGGQNTNKTDFVRPLAVPHAKSYRIFNSQPVFDDKSEVGVYDSGEFSVTRAAAVSNGDYAPTYNPYTYLMTGERMATASAKSFSSLELIFSWDRTKTETFARNNNWTRYDMTLSVKQLKYDGITDTNNSSITYPEVVGKNGSYTSMPTILSEQLGGLYTVPDTTIRIDNATPGSTNGASANYGNAQISTGSRVWFSIRGVMQGAALATKTAGSEHLFMWDSSAFKFDTSLPPYYYTYSTQNNSAKFEYGVIKSGKLNNSPPYTMKVGQLPSNKDFYNWYDTAAEAEAAGEICAVLYTGKYDHNPAHTAIALEKTVVIPVIVTANSGAKTPKNNAVVLLGSQRFIDKSGEVMFDSAVYGSAGKTGGGNTAGYGTYVPTPFQSNGQPPMVGGEYKYPMEYWNQLGESAYVKNISITTKTDVVESLYKSNEKVDIKVNAVVKGSKDSSLDSSITTILPKGLSYDFESGSTDSLGNVIPEPSIQSNPDGTTTLIWNFTKVSVLDGLEVNFKGILNQQDLVYKNTGYTDNLTVKTVGEVWATRDKNSKDTSPEKVRSSSDYFMVQRMQQVIVSKDADKPLIEVGNQGDLNPNTSITYDVTLLNESLDDIVDGRLLDVLPFDNDGRGTKFSGNYTVTNVQVTGPSPTITFSNSSMAYDTDPNSVSGWTTYKPGVDPVNKIKDAKAIMVSVPRLAVDAKVTLKITIQPKDQKAGDVLINNAQMNSDFDLQVNSQAVWTRVYGRDLTGVAWYDDNYDGLIGNMADGSAEIFAKDIPVKLYRTSLEDTSYKNKLVKENLTGEKLIDASGNSLVKTDENGKYKFSNLAEGTYVAEFIVNDRVVRKEVQVTTPDIGNDSTLNSKASQTTHKTPGYKQPVLTDLPTATTPADPTHHITDVNIGLIRASRIRVYKFETGTAVDANNDGVLSDVEKASGRPIEGAEFTIYHDGVAQGTATTDETGFLLFDFFFRGDYTLIETKAPPGFELITYPLEVTIKEGNETIILYQENDPTTKLPFTGGNGPVRLFILAAGSIFLASFLGIAWHYRTPKKKGEA
ncbi:hypothetical protein BAU15_03460 [Enterococcus sp. JM4C]|uniref:SpaA isopeptide-forming pilin-related protein n=1 Tax=Candidatus Enterococcus huntleyi TaxID=1857217 RepID=UPI001379585A|nr:SpaA isopeptide-forming pilin-related protein [Enterococcus sp. JM4C]KAF1295612.1 hypothetical protein BAU15_03460 [Enterococcus sp. JM4C]